MNSYLKPYMKISSGQTVWFHAVVISGQAIGIPLGGMLERKIGYRLVEIIGAVLTSGGVMLSSLTVDYGLGPFIATYAVMFGLGMGTPYSVLFSLAADWFPKHRAAVIGIILGGLGMGALVFTPFQTALINPDNLPPNDPRVMANVRLSFVKLGSFMVSLQIIGFILVRKNRSEEEEEFDAFSSSESDSEFGKSKSSSNDKSDAYKIASETDTEDFVAQHNKEQEIYNYTIKEAMKSIDFYTICLMIFLDTVPITLQTSTYKVFGSNLGIDDKFLSTVATCTSIFNCSGRVIWGLLSDCLSFKIPCGWFLLQWAILFGTLPAIGLLPMNALKPLYTIWVFLLFFSMAGHFVLMPAACSRIFGPKNSATTYGLLYFTTCPSALILAAITSTNDINKDFNLVFYCCCGILLASFVLHFFLQDRFGKLVGLTRICVKMCNPCRYVPDEAAKFGENVDDITEIESQFD
nr:oxalate:formate antiporter [Hymenolepis microstoma]